MLYSWECEIRFNRLMSMGDKYAYYITNNYSRREIINESVKFFRQ